MITIPVFLNIPLHIWLGFLLLVLLIIQILSGNNIIKTSLRFHKIIAWMFLVIALIHGYIAFGVTFLGFKIM
jgi:hypothetical protein